jgi:hypothetical protein
MAYCGPKGLPLSQFLAWPESDQDAALTWQAHEARKCTECGTHPDDWAQNWWYAWEAEAYRCRGCQVVGDKRDEIQKQDKRGNGVHVRLTRK